MGDKQFDACLLRGICAAMLLLALCPGGSQLLRIGG